jgi:hypothetical protein
MLLRQLKRRFGPLPPETEARVRAAGPDRLDLWGERILESDELHQILKDD